MRENTCTRSVVTLSFANTLTVRILVEDDGGRMMTFQFQKKMYTGKSALDIVRGLERDAEHYPHRGQSVRQFLKWSLQHLRDLVPPRDLHLSDMLEDDELALSYLCLREEYGAGKLLINR